MEIEKMSFPKKRNGRKYTPKKEMALAGYYIGSDFAKLTGITRQAVDKSKHIYSPIEKHGRKWYKFDNGEAAHSKFGTIDMSLEKFIPFGFKQRTHSLIESNKTMADIKSTPEGKIQITFFNEVGKITVLADPGSIRV